jgi:hypothetical protein
MWVWVQSTWMCTWGILSQVSSEVVSLDRFLSQKSQRDQIRWDQTLNRLKICTGIYTRWLRPTRRIIWSHCADSLNMAIGVQPMVRCNCVTPDGLPDHLIRLWLDCVSSDQDIRVHCAPVCLCGTQHISSYNSGFNCVSSTQAFEVHYMIRCDHVTPDVSSS